MRKDIKILNATSFPRVSSGSTKGYLKFFSLAALTILFIIKLVEVHSTSSFW